LSQQYVRCLAATTLCLSSSLTSLRAQEVDAAARPVVTMRYVGLTNPEPFKFTSEGRGPVEKSVGDMAFEFPDGSAPTGGLQATPKSFCIEPLVPIYAGRNYNFAVDRVNDPKYYGLPDTVEGNAAAETRATYLRELYGRHYADILGDDKTAVAAFQVALWEIAKETQVPDGPLPYNLYTGAFRATYPNEAAAPESVRRAQTYLQELTGNDTPFREAQTLQGLELVRMTGLPGADGFVPQSQLMLRASPAFGGGGGGGAPAGGFGPSGGSPVLGGGLPLGGLGGRGGSGPPFVPGGLGGGGFLPLGGVGSPNTDVSTVTDNQPTTSSPQETAVTTPPVIVPLTEGPLTEGPPVVTPPIIVPPPGGGGEEGGGIPPAVPAPPAVVLLALGGIGMIAYRRRRATLSA
jgi:hypothetical protein